MKENPAHPCLYIIERDFFNTNLLSFRGEGTYGGFMRHVFLLLVFFMFSSTSYADEAWKRVSGIKESDVKEVTVKDDVVYAASEKNLYHKAGSEDTWRIVFSTRGNNNGINFISAFQDSVFVCTGNGLFKSTDGKSNWKRVFKGVGTRGSDISHIAFSKDGKAYLATKGGLFISSDNGVTFQKDPGEAGSLIVKWSAFLEEKIFLAAEKGIYSGSPGSWKRVFVTIAEDAVYDSDLEDEAISAVKPVNSIFVRDKEIFLATDSGIFFSRDKGNSWEDFTSKGLLSEKVKRLLFSDNLYAATDKGVFVFSDRDKIWKAVYKGMDADKVRSMAADNKGIIWAATNKGVYKFLPLTLSLKGRRSISEEDILKLFDNEPNIREVQNAAIEYAEVHPNKIKKWRESARKKALLPDVSIGLDRYVTDLYHWDAGQNPDVLQRGRDIITWDVTMSWDLGDFIWSTDQTSIDTRSRLMVQLRDDILDETTRTYFERCRLQIETHFLPPEDLKAKMERELRIQELTADLDALTGGYFSENTHK